MHLFVNLKEDFNSFIAHRFRLFILPKFVLNRPKFHVNLLLVIALVHFVVVIMPNDLSNLALKY